MNTPRESYSRPELTKRVLGRLNGGEPVDVGKIVADYGVKPSMAMVVYHDAKSQYGVRRKSLQNNGKGRGNC